jgi:hypothetical protein
MRLAYYIAYNPITKTYVGVLKRAYKEKLERLAASLPYYRYQGDFISEGKAYDPTFSNDVLPELVKVFNNRMTDIKYYSSKKANEAVAFFIVPDKIASSFPGRFPKYKYVVAIFDTSEIMDLRDAEKIYMYDNKKEAWDLYETEVTNLKYIEEYSKSGSFGSSSEDPEMVGTLTKLRSSRLFSKLSRLRRSEDLGRFERLGSSWDFLFKED